MTELLLGEALGVLAEPGLPYEDAIRAVPPRPGLYAIRGSAAVWQQIGLGVPPDHRPLYVGKAESSLLGRDLKTHFRTGCTGSSTVRRSLAALLSDSLGLVAQPRSLTTPGHFANYGLEAAGDARLTTWMIDHLRLATWEAPAGTVLREVELQLLARLLPPLNQDSAPTPWRPQIRAARRAMANQARSGRVSR